MSGLWKEGDLTRIAETMGASGDALVNDLGISRSIKILDLGCADGKRQAVASSWEIGSQMIQHWSRRS
jgi:hypothetical protein